MNGYTMGFIKDHIIFHQLSMASVVILCEAWRTYQHEVNEKTFTITNDALVRHLLWNFKRWSPRKAVIKLSDDYQRVIGVEYTASIIF